MKTPEEIKKGLECCVGCDNEQPICSRCSYKKADDTSHCSDLLRKDAIAYIQQLEAQIPKWIGVDESLPKYGERVLITEGTAVVPFIFADDRTCEVHYADYCPVCGRHLI